MKTHPNYPHRSHDTGALLRSLLIAIIALVLIMVITGCTVVTAPDGTVTRTPDHAVWAEFGRIIATK